MSVTLTVVAFFGYLVFSIISSFVLAAGLDKIGVRLHLAPGLFGLVTAIGADAPEVSSAIVALTGGHHNLSFSVVFGSNIFNLAALLGLSAVVAGDVQISRSRLFLNGAAGVLIIAVATALLLGYLSPWLAVVLTAAVFIPYAILVGLHPTHIRRIIPRGWLRDFLSAALTPARGDEPDEQVAKTGGGWREMLSVLPALVGIIFASRGLVNSAVVLAGHWNIDYHIVGVLILSTLTGIPNVVAAVRLALKRRGAAVVSEALNSNTLNLLAGVCVPALVLGLGTPSQLTLFAVWWLLGMTAVTLALTSFQNHLGRWGGICLIGLYLAFIGIVVFS